MFAVWLALVIRERWGCAGNTSPGRYNPGRSAWWEKCFWLEPMTMEDLALGPSTWATTGLFGQPIEYFGMDEFMHIELIRGGLEILPDAKAFNPGLA